MRKARTPAGFVPKPCETAATKTAETWPTEPTKKKEKRLPPARKSTLRNERLGGLQATRQNLRKKWWGAQAKSPNPSRFRAQAMRNRSHKNCRNVAYGTHKKERKKIASSKEAKATVYRCSGNALHNERLASLQAANPRKRSLWSACEKPEPQQVSCPSHAKPLGSLAQQGSRARGMLWDLEAKLLGALPLSEGSGSRAWGML